MAEASTQLEPTRQQRSQRKDAPRLEVYVSSECSNCREAVRLAHEAAARFPDVRVRVIDVEQLDSNAPPEPVVAVPTYLLDGRVISLGNPYPKELFVRLRHCSQYPEVPTTST